MQTLVTILFFTLTPFNNADQGARVKAMHMYNFVRNMDWPAEKQGDQYTIAVLGDVNVLNQIKTVTEGKMVNNRPIRAINYTSETDMSQINILFLSSVLTDQFGEFQKLAIPNGVVIVTEQPGMSKKGAAVNFVSSEGKVGFELNRETLNQSHVNISRAIVSSAKVVN